MAAMMTRGTGIQQWSAGPLMPLTIVVVGWPVGKVCVLCPDGEQIGHFEFVSGLTFRSAHRAAVSLALLVKEWM